jgi:hypothetical protein
MSRKQQKLSVGDLDWLESRFREFNEANGYPSSSRSAVAPGNPTIYRLPTFEGTRRYRWETRRKPIRYVLSLLGVPNRKLITRRSEKRAA